jgi:hypothetical protein
LTELGTLAETGTKVLGSRTLVNVLPPALLTVIVFVLLASGAPGTLSTAALVTTLKDFSGAQVALLFLGVVVVAVILQPFQIAVVQILEGYWVGNPLARSGRPSMASRAWDIGTELQRRRFRLLQILEKDENDDEGDADDLADELSELRIKQAGWARGELRGYPELETRLMPTRLGNQLRAAEDDAGGRYGLWTNVVYPRLQSVLSDRLASDLASSNDQLDLAAHLCVTLALATLASAGLLAPNGWRNPWWLLVPAATAALAFLSYRAAIKAAASQGVLLAAAFDLHRFDLLTALHYRLPDDPWSEYRFNGELSAFLAHARASMRPADIDGSNAPEDMLLAVDYEHPAGPAEDGGARRPPGPFQPFRWDWDAILGEGGEAGNGAERPDERQPHP